MLTTFHRHSWAWELDRFSRRNAGRRAVLEIDEIDLGAQRLADFPLWGLLYEAPSEEVEILFGDFTSEGSHLSHAVEDVREISLLTGADGRDEVLRIATPGGQALLHLPREA
jgi:hypothetical protein